MNGRGRAVGFLLFLLAGIVGFTAWMSQLELTWQTVVAVLALLLALFVGLLAVALRRQNERD